MLIEDKNNNQNGWQITKFVFGYQNITYEYNISHEQVYFQVLYYEYIFATSQKTYNTQTIA